MKKTGFLYDDRYFLHDTGPYHPEVPERLRAIYKGIESAGLLDKLTLIKGTRAEIKWIETIHDNDYIGRLGDACIAGQKMFEYPDNQMSAETFEIAMLAVGGILKTADMIMQKDINNAFCAVRPPGHHAEKTEAMGFCYFNNVAIAAKYLQQQWNIKKVLIMDFDVHHGNGTQHAFEEDPTVFYYSIHEHPSFAFPGTGRTFEQGQGEGIGFTCNNPVLPGQGDDEYKKILTEEFIPEFEKFAPDFLIISTGFDAHEDDDMSRISVTTAGFSWIMQLLNQLAEKYTGGKILSVLEGGYSLQRLPELAANHINILLCGNSAA